MTAWELAPQAERVLAILRRRGARGTNRLDWAGPDVIDGGKPILHVGERIRVLRAAGFNISSHRGPHRLAQYVLEPDEAAAVLPLPASSAFGPRVGPAPWEPGGPAWKPYRWGDGRAGA